MSTAEIVTDADIQSAVQAELDWTPEVDAAGIGVAVQEGTVTLSGEVRTTAEQVAAKKAALRVRGVIALVDQLRVHPGGSGVASTDLDVAKEVDHALRAAANVPDSIQAEIHLHHVTLTGHAQWDYQRHAAMRAVEHLRGVYSVSDTITLVPRAPSEDAAAGIARALLRNAQLDAASIRVTVDGTKAVLTGTVSSWAQKRQAEKAAWASLHVSEVENLIAVRPGE